MRSTELHVWHIIVYCSERSGQILAQLNPLFFKTKCLLEHNGRMLYVSTSLFSWHINTLHLKFNKNRLLPVQIMFDQ